MPYSVPKTFVDLASDELEKDWADAVFEKSEQATSRTRRPE
jgi:hypothetical protein